MADEIWAIDVMNYLFTPEFWRGWMSSREMQMQNRLAMHGRINEMINGWTAEAFVARMDEGKFDKILVSCLKMFSWIDKQFIANATSEQVYEVTKKYPKRLVGIAGYNPMRIKESLLDIENAVKNYGFKGVYAHVHGFGIRLDDRKMYPLYQKCTELGVPVILQTGHSLEIMPSDVGRPIYLDNVLLDFPDVSIIASHTGWPWCEEAISLCIKFPNIYIDISAHLPKYLDKSIVQFMNTRGRDRVMFGTNGFPFPLSTFREGFLALGLREETNRKVLRENAIRVFKL